MNSAKQDVQKLLQKLPEDCSVEDVQYHLYVLEKVRRGLEDARTNGGLSQEEVEGRLSKRLIEESARGARSKISKQLPNTLLRILRCTPPVSCEL